MAPLTRSLAHIFRRVKGLLCLAGPSANKPHENSQSVGPLDTSPATSPPPKITVFSVLAVGGRLEDRDAGWICIDWLLFSTLLARQPQFDLTKSRFLRIRGIGASFPDGKFSFGDAGCDRLTLPIPAFLLEDTAECTAQEFVETCYIELSFSASYVKPGELFIIVLAGHGEVRHGCFRLCVSTLPQRGGEAWVTKTKLESVASRCLGEVIVISDSCHSGALKSSYWKLLCAAGPTQMSDSLTTSESGKARGSAFAFSTLAEIATSQGLSIPRPRLTPRPKEIPDEEIVPLPESPPLHSFAFNNRPLFPPLKNSVPILVEGMQGWSQFLIFSPQKRFHQYGFDSRPWWETLPLALPQTLVDEMDTLPEGSGFISNFNSMVYPLPTQTGGSSSVQKRGSSPATTIAQDLPNVSNEKMDRAIREATILASLFIKTTNTLGRDQPDSVQCHQFLSDPQSLHPYNILDLWQTLRTRHLQSVASQLAVVELGWCAEPAMIVPFLSLAGTLRGESAAMVLERDGGVLDCFGQRVAAAFPDVLQYAETACVWWLTLNWDRAGRPVITEADLGDALDRGIKKVTQWAKVDV
ncbi:hypothetical protein B0H12DRAFT_349322 [Mycena haematopus]|nr:hypothetical protein B0H12DRAFT_349322 [Mycena haematopus]